MGRRRIKMSMTLSEYTHRELGLPAKALRLPDKPPDQLTTKEIGRWYLLRELVRLSPAELMTRHRIAEDARTRGGLDKGFPTPDEIVMRAAEVRLDGFHGENSWWPPWDEAKYKARADQKTSPVDLLEFIHPFHGSSPFHGSNACS